MEDMDIEEFAFQLTLLEPDTPATVELDQWGSPYDSQKAHMVLWCRDQVNARGKGPYGRTKSNHSARTMYNRFNNPGGLIWMAEALGESTSVIRKAVTAVLIAESTGNKRGRCNVFRAIIPWERIMELMQTPTGWRFDPALMPFAGFDDDGFPLVDDSWFDTYDKVVFEEIYSDT